MRPRNMAWVWVAIGALVVAMWLRQSGSSSAMAVDLIPKVSQQRWEYAQCMCEPGVFVLWLPGQSFKSYEDAMKGLGGERGQVGDTTAKVYAVMNQLGNQGWELVSVTHLVDRHGSDNNIYYFKRAK